MAAFFIFAFIFFGSANYYVYRRGMQALSFIPKWAKWVISILYVITATGYVSRSIPFISESPVLYEFLLTIGATWFAALIYFLLSILLIDVVRLFDRFFHFLPKWTDEQRVRVKFKTFLAVVIVVIAVLGAGHYNATNLTVKTVEITLPKKKSTLDSLTVVFFSDLHISALRNEAYMETITAAANELKPDLILLGGDIVDDKAHVIPANLGTYLERLHARLGVYSVLGNHEYISGVDESVNYFKEHNVTLLRDSLVVFDGLLQLIGRDDRSANRRESGHRKPLDTIFAAGVDTLPSILVDHQPLELNEAAEAGIDFQLSGHTHQGQLFPNNFIVGLMYELSWGYLQKENTQYYISCGIGTWGPPIRTTGRAEMVCVKITFR